MDRTVVENAIVTWTVPVVENAIVTWAVPVVENAAVMWTVLIVELLYSESNPKGAVFSQPVRFGAETRMACYGVYRVCKCAQARLCRGTT